MGERVGERVVLKEAFEIEGKKGKNFKEEGGFINWEEFEYVNNTCNTYIYVAFVKLCFNTQVG